MARNFAASQRIAVPSGAGLFGQSAATILGWFNVLNNSDYAFLYHEQSNWNEDINVHLETNGTLQFFWRTATALMSITSASAYDDGVWHRVQCVRRANNDFQAWVDGVSIGTSTANPGTISVSPTIYVGANAYDGTQVLTGSAARLITVKRALTVGEGSTAHYTGRVAGAKNLHLELGYGSPEPDWSGNVYNGTVTSATIAANPPMCPMAA